MRLRDEREQVNSVERELREAQFSQRECRGKIDEITRGRELACKQIDRIVDELARCTENAEAMQAEDLEPRLQEALETRVVSERAMAAARWRADSRVAAAVSGMARTMPSLPSRRQTRPLPQPGAELVVVHGCQYGAAT